MNKKSNIISVRIDDWSVDKIKEFKIDCTDFDLTTSDVIISLIEFADFCNNNPREEICTFKDWCNSRTNYC